MTDDSRGRLIAEVCSVIAFRHVGPFPEWSKHHPRHKDVLLCPDCLEDWCDAMIDPTFDDRVIEQGMIYLDADGQETDDYTNRYVEAVTQEEIADLVASGGPKRCEACGTPWDRVEGIRVIFR